VTLWIVVPAYNEAESLPQVLPNIAASAADIDSDACVLVVDDGSTDGTAAVVESVRESHPAVKLISLGANKGKAAALKRGLGMAVESGASIVAMMDADGQDDPAELARLIDHLAEPGISLVTGARTIRNDRFIKRNTSKIYNWATSTLSGVPGRDFNSGFKVMRAAVARDVAPMMYGELHRYLTVMAHWLGYQVAEVPVQHHPRLAGESKYGLDRFWRGFVDLLTIRFLMSYEHRPSHLFSGFGFMGLFSGGVILTYLVFIRLVLGEGISDRPLLIAGVMLFLGGLQLILFGLLAELVVHARNRAPVLTPAGEQVTGD
jgi:glycosyltransferase involved in cell wall biosynthesis